MSEQTFGNFLFKFYLFSVKDCSSVNEFSEVATLVPGIRKEERVTTVSGADVGGIPTSYTLKGT